MIVYKQYIQILLSTNMNDFLEYYKQTNQRVFMEFSTDEENNFTQAVCETVLKFENRSEDSFDKSNSKPLFELGVQCFNCSIISIVICTKDTINQKGILFSFMDNTGFSKYLNEAYKNSMEESAFDNTRRVSTI